MPAESRVEVDDTFEGRIVSLTKCNATVASAITDATQSGWMHPTSPGSPGDNGWDGNLFNLDKLSEPFSRENISNEFRDAVSDVDNSGVSGDLASASLQADYLGVMERAYRARHTMRRPRAMAHAAGRMHGHANLRGVLTQTALEFIRGVVKESRAGEG